MGTILQLYPELQSTEPLIEQCAHREAQLRIGLQNNNEKQLDALWKHLERCVLVKVKERSMINRLKCS
jgi:RNAse (barnase) inhibitor barstar